MVVDAYVVQVEGLLVEARMPDALPLLLEAEKHVSSEAVSDVTLVDA